jgi:hypothetical protein
MPIGALDSTARFGQSARVSERERTEAIGLGFVVADATSPSLNLDGQVLTVRFLDWQEQTITLVCYDVIALRWQEADRYIDENDRFDSTFVVQHSEWLAEHKRQGILFGAGQFQHLKLNFNAAGILEVLCTRTQVERTGPA